MKLYPKNLYFEKEIQLEFTLQFDEFMESVNKQASKIKYIYYLLPIIGFFGYFNPVIFELLLPENEEHINIFSWMYFSKHIIYILLILFPFYLRFFIKRLFKREGMKEVAYKFKDKNVIIHTNLSVSEVKLDKIVRAIVTENLIILYFSKSIANVIPKRAFHNKEELNYFINQLKLYSN